MAVVLQQVVGVPRGDVLYPDVSGIAASHNFYPVREMRPEQGVASVALGLGKAVVEGERTVRFSPPHPQWLPQMSTPADVLENAQRDFYALDLTRSLDFREPDPDLNVVRLPLSVAEEDNALWPVASVYSPENDAIYDGVSRPGVRLVTMAPILKHSVFPLAEILRSMLELGRLGMSVPVEIEFAANVQRGGEGRAFALLQVRPLGVRGETTAVRLDDIEPADVFLRSTQALGTGRTTSIRDIVAVRLRDFDRGRTLEIADEIGARNAALVAARRPYLLVGQGRWGTSDRWLGVPVTWSQIAGVRAIVECALGGMDVEPSQGTHFFHNLTSFGIPYFTVPLTAHQDVDWGWLEGLDAADRGRFVDHYRLDEPLEILIDGHSGEGVILKRLRPE